MNEQHEVVLLVADKHREQWLHGVLSHISKIHLCFPKAEDQNRPAVYLTDEVSYQRHLDAFSQLRAHITPDSPALLFFIEGQPPASVVADEMFLSTVDAEFIRERVQYWLELRDSLNVWWNATTLSRSDDVPHEHPASFTTVASPKTQIDPIATQVNLPAELNLLLMSALFDISSQGMFVADASGHFLRVNTALCNVFEFDMDTLVGQSAECLLPKKEFTDFFSKLFDNTALHQGWEGELRCLKATGEIIPIWLTLRYLSSHPSTTDVAVGFFIGIITDLSVSRMLEESVLELSRTDSLSELNRVLLEERLALDIRYAERNHRYVAVLYINLRRFRMINERFGYAFGDWVLMSQLQRLRTFIDTRGMVSRLFANNFVVVLPNLDTPDEASRIAHLLIEHLAAPLSYNQKEVISVPNIGLAYHPGQGETAAELLRHAELAMDWCRNDVNCFVQVFDEELQALMQNQVRLEQELWTALQQKEFFLEYQPQYSLSDGKVPAVEALIRWQKDGGVSYPKDFILFAEENDLIIPITNWVIREACEQAKRWLDEGCPLVVSVNISALHFDNEMLVEYIAQVLKETALPPKYLDIEVTESCIMKEVSQSVETLNALKALGVSLSVDDFGTGYSSLSYLKLFPINKLKIDRSFIVDLGSNSSDAMIVRAIIALGQAMGLTIVAEGVETEEQFAYLQEWKCDMMQGYLFLRPQRAENLLTLIAEKLRHGLRTTEQNAAVSSNLLLVDDEPAILNAIKRSLRTERYKILTANSVAEAMELLALHEVGVIVTDNRMPNGHGIDLLHHVKQRFPDITRIMLSGYSDFEALSSAINAGEIYRFISKPWDDTELKNVIREGFTRYDERKNRRQPNAQVTHLKDK